MTRTVTVDVTARDIAQGVRYDCNFCPIARALGRVVASPVTVSRGLIGFYPPGATDRGDAHLLGSVATPLCARDFIDAFDLGGAARPFRFELPVPDGAVLRA